MKRTSFWAAIVLALVLTLGASAVVMAAPPAEEGVAVGTYVSAVYPAADASGMVQVLSIYQNNNVQSITYYLGKDAPVVEVGTWEMSGEDLAVTLTGTPTEAYKEPSVTTYKVDGDKLVDGAFVLTLLDQMTSEDMDAAASAAPSDAAPSNEDPSGTYVTNVYPAADASGLVQLLMLYPNNNAAMSSIYIGKDAPVDEIGTWKLTEDGAVEVTITGTADKEYDSPSVTTYTRSGDSLVDGAFVFNLLPVVTPEEMDAITAAQEAATNAINEASGTYVSSVYPAADAPGMVTVMTLYPNMAAEQTTIYFGKLAVMEVGSWELGESNTLTVTMTGTLDKAYDTPASTVYQIDGETLVDGIFVFAKLPVVTPEEMEAAMPAPEATEATTATEASEATSATVEPVAFYESDVLPAADTPGRVISLTLFSDNTVNMATDWMNDEPARMEIGTWSEPEDGKITVTITGTPEEAYEKPDVVTFEKQGDQIVAVEYDQSMWGSEGLTLTEKPLPDAPQ